LPKPGQATARYGGNTSCVQVEADDSTLVVLDCGTGAHELGQHLASRASARGHLLLTHTHWDHIQGFPFFSPLFAPANEWDVYAPHGAGRPLEQTLAMQMEYSYFPVGLRQMAASIHYHELVEGPFNLGALRVTARYLNHPGLALGYRLEMGGVAVVYATDHEPHAAPGPEASDAGGDAGRFVPIHREDQQHIEFLAGADLVIHDAQYTLEEYPARRTWGHTPAELAVDFSVAAGAKRLALFHHDPSRTDEALDLLLDRCRRRAERAGSALEVFAASEGLIVQLAAVAAEASPATRAAVVRPADDRPVSPTLLLVDDDPDILRLLTLTLRSEGFRLLTASDGETALAMARSESPDLVLLDRNLPGRDGLAICRALRAEPDVRLRDVPIVLLTGEAEPEDTASGFAAGATDYVIKPFKPTHVRARVQAWLLRRRAGAGQEP
jgi:CheY-like chemotaxis protein/phosphoribosyl 1,2-cyclic phosphodiesterase